MNVPTWQKVFRAGFAPRLSLEALEALAGGLAENDGRLTQGVTTTPLSSPRNADCPLEAGCVICYALWRGRCVRTVGEAEEEFARLCFEVDAQFGMPGACRFFLNYADDAPRNELRRELAHEVRHAISERIPVGA